MLILFTSNPCRHEVSQTVTERLQDVVLPSWKPDQISQCTGHACKHLCPGPRSVIFSVRKWNSLFRLGMIWTHSFLLHHLTKTDFSSTCLEWDWGHLRMSCREKWCSLLNSRQLSKQQWERLSGLIMAYIKSKIPLWGPVMLLLPFVRCIITLESKNSEAFVKSWINIPNNPTAVSRSGQYPCVSKTT